MRASDNNEAMATAKMWVMATSTRVADNEGVRARRPTTSMTMMMTTTTTTMMMTMTTTMIHDDDDDDDGGGGVNDGDSG
jgi:hypothetical protein